MRNNISVKLLGAFLQSKGRLGKSWLTLLLAAWLMRWEIPWTGFDADDQHRTFHPRYPQLVKPLTIADEISGADEMMRVWRTTLAGQTPVVLFDTRAQLSGFLLQCLDRSRFIELSEPKGVAITALIFPADDDDSIQTLIRGLQHVGENVDFLIVKNPALYGTRRYEGSPLQQTLLDAGAAEITLPALCESTKRAIVKVEKERGHPLDFPSALEHLQDFSRADLEFFLSVSFAEFDRVAHLLLPTELLSKITPSSPNNDKAQPFNNLNVNLE